jgi:hypothetical protein
MCECYTIGGPWIAEDPDCPAHGHEAQEEQRLREEEMDSLRAEVAEMKRLLAVERANKK